MSEIEKIELAIDKGVTVDVELGIVYGVRGKEILNTDKIGYRKFAIYNLNKKRYFISCHRLIFYFKNKYLPKMIDHINGNKLDNRIINLRECDRKLNQQNRRTTKGYYFNKIANKFMAQINVDGKKYNLGLFNTEQEAREAYLKAKPIYHKENPIYL